MPDPTSVLPTIRDWWRALLSWLGITSNRHRIRPLSCDYVVVPLLRGVQQTRTHMRLTERELVEITGGIEVIHEEVRSARHSDRSPCFGVLRSGHGAVLSCTRTAYPTGPGARFGGHTDRDLQFRLDQARTREWRGLQRPLVSSSSPQPHGIKNNEKGSNRRH